MCAENSESSRRFVAQRVKDKRGGLVHDSACLTTSLALQQPLLHVPGVGGPLKAPFFQHEALLALAIGIISTLRVPTSAGRPESNIAMCRKCEIAGRREISTQACF